MSATTPILNSVKARLQAALPHVLVELFPDNPASYRFMHPLGAVLIAYEGGKYKRLEDIGMVVQERQVILHITVFSRSLHGEAGGHVLLDEVRLAIAGFAPTSCTPCHLIDDGFLAENGGTWQHFLRAQTETEQVQISNEQDLPKFIRARLRHAGDALDDDLQPNQ